MVLRLRVPRLCDRVSDSFFLVRVSCDTFVKAHPTLTLERPQELVCKIRLELLLFAGS